MNEYPTENVQAMIEGLGRTVSNQVITIAQLESLVIETRNALDATRAALEEARSAGQTYDEIPVASTDA